MQIQNSNWLPKKQVKGIKMIHEDENKAVDARLAKQWDRFMSNPGVHPLYKQATMRPMVFAVNTLLSHNHSEKTFEDLVKHRLEKNLPQFLAICENEKPIELSDDIKALSNEDDLEITFEKIPGSDNNTIPVGIFRPAGVEGPLPCVMYIHGGGMAFNSIMVPEYYTFIKTIAKQGVVVVAPEFRNTTVPTELNPDTSPYPGGLNDCYSTLKWIHENKESLNIDDRIIVSGDSGGGNLTLCLTIKCIREGQRKLIAHGIYPLCPYIAGNWPQNESNNGILGTSHLDSENNNIFLGLPENETAALEYSLEAFRNKDALSWAAFAKDEDLEQFPRVTMQVSELDPLRDEAILFYRRLLKAGVRATCKQLMGAVHAAEIMSPSLPEITLDSSAAIAAFARTRPFI